LFCCFLQRGSDGTGLLVSFYVAVPPKLLVPDSLAGYLIFSFGGGINLEMFPQELAKFRYRSKRKVQHFKNLDI
jgi:hypothetical protein